jgi:hypothetical protein
MRRWEDEAGALEALVPEPDPASEPAVDDPDEPAPWMAAITERPDRSGTFFRMVELPGELLAPRLVGLWAAGAAVDVGRCRLVGRPSARGAGVMIRGRWRRPMHRTALPVEIELWPHLDRWTIITLAPRRRVRLSHRYYEGGHRLLDALTLALAPVVA